MINQKKNIYILGEPISPHYICVESTIRKIYIKKYNITLVIKECSIGITIVEYNVYVILLNENKDEHFVNSFKSNKINDLLFKIDNIIDLLEDDNIKYDIIY